MNRFKIDLRTFALTTLMAAISAPVTAQIPDVQDTSSKEPVKKTSKPH